MSPFFNGRSMTVPALLAMLLCVTQAKAADKFPPHFIGIWATADSVFIGDSLYGGTAVYLDVDGEAALVGAPLPARKCGDNWCGPVIGIKMHATLEPDGRTIRAAINDYGQQKREILFAYDEAAGTLTFQAGQAEKQVVKRRTGELPAAFKAGLHETPRSAGYARTSPASTPDAMQNRPTSFMRAPTLSQPPAGYVRGWILTMELETAEEAAVSALQTIFLTKGFLPQVSKTTGADSSKPLLKIVGSKRYAAPSSEADEVLAEVQKAATGFAGKLTWSVADNFLPM